MSCFTIYGLRAKYDREVRYIGQTNGLIETRLHLHRIAARLGRLGEFGEWLAYNPVEVFKIGETDTRARAREFESLCIATSLATGQRLFNKRHLSSPAVTPFTNSRLRPLGANGGGTCTHPASDTHGTAKPASDLAGKAPSGCAPIPEGVLSTNAASGVWASQHDGENL